MGPLNDENQLQNDERNKKKFRKIEKTLKVFKWYNINIFKTIRNKLTASGNISYSIFNYKFIGPVSNLRLLKE